MLVMLDALVDTRVGVVNMLYPEAGKSLLTNMQYRNRLSDELHLVDPRIDALKYSLRYAARDLDVLDFSKSTLMIPYINRLISALQDEVDSNNPIIKNVRVIINVYPYILDEDRCKLISLAVSTALHLVDVCEMVYIPPADITKEFLKDNSILHLILYDFNEWSVAALPDVEGSSLDDIGLNRMENLTITAAKLVVKVEDDVNAKLAFEEYGVLGSFDELSVLPWNLLFDLDLLNPIFYTQYDEQLKEAIMSIHVESNKSIDIEVSLIAEFQHLFNLSLNSHHWRKVIPTRLMEIGSRCSLLLENPTADNLDELRLLLAENRYLTDVLSNIIPTQPSIDFERLVDSNMSRFDDCMENSQISESHWNDKGVKCRRLVKNIDSIDREAYILVAYENCVDCEGNHYAKGDILTSVMFFEPILEKVTQTEIAVFLDGIKES